MYVYTIYVIYTFELFIGVSVPAPSMIDSIENATPPKSTKSRNSNSSVQIQIKPKSQVEFLLRDTETSEYFPRFGGFWECSNFRGKCHMGLHVAGSIKL